MIVTAKEMRAIREGKDNIIDVKVVPKKKKSERDQLFLDLKKKGIEYKGNMSNVKLQELLDGDK